MLQEIVAPFRRLHGIPAGSHLRTRLFYDADLRKTFDKIEDIACKQLRQQRPRTFTKVEEIVFNATNVVKALVELEGVVLTEHVPEELIEELRQVG